MRSGKTRESEGKGKGKSEKGSQRSRENGSKRLTLRLLLLFIGIIDIVDGVVEYLVVWLESGIKMRNEANELRGSN